MSLINKLPSFYDNDIVKPIQNSFTVEANSINDEVENTLNQFSSVQKFHNCVHKILKYQPYQFHHYHEMFRGTCIYFRVHF